MIIKARERWIKIEKLNGKKYDFVKNYMVSNYGRFMSNDEMLTGYKKGGYVLIQLQYIDKYGTHKRKTVSAHIIVAENFVDNPNKDKFNIVNHKDGNKSHNYYKNLEWTNQQGNVDHAIDNGLFHWGEKSGSSTLSNEQAHDICRLMQDGMKNKDIIESLGFEYSKRMADILSSIRNGRDWTNISKNYNIPIHSKVSLSDNQVHGICNMLVNNHSYKSIIDKYELSYLYSDPIVLLGQIKSLKRYERIGKDYFTHM